MALQSSQRLPELLFYTKKSYKILQAPIPAPILHVHITENSTCRRQRALRVLQSSSRNSTHRRQGDLLEMHPCVLQDIPGNSSCSRDIPDIPVIHDLPAFPGNSTMFQVSPGNPPHSSILRLECIFYNSTVSTVRLVSTENSTEYQLGNYRHYKHSFFKEREMLRYRLRCQDVKMTYFLE